MEYKKSMIIVILAVFLFSVASVCAIDVNDTQVDSEDANQMELSSNIEIAEDNLQVSEENATLELSNDGGMLSEGDVGTFSDLSSKISGYEVKLDNDYECEDGFFSSGIQIWESHIIDGQGHTIDAKGKARIFDITFYEGGSVVFKNITFMNGYDDVEGGAFLIIGGNCSFVNCTFVNNTANRGGAILGFSSNINFSDCTFINNRADHDGAIHNAGATIYAERCNFKTKSDSISGVNLAVHSFAFSSNRYRCGEKITFDCDASDIMLEFYRFDKLFCTYHCSGQDAIVLPYFGEDEYQNPYPYDVFYNSNGTRIYVGILYILRPQYFPTNLTVSAATVYNSNDYLTITLKDDGGSPLPGRDLIVDFNGVKTLKTDDNGQIKVSTEGLAPGVYTLRARFEDSNVFGKSECCVDITVKKAATSIISSAVATVYNEDGYLKATLKDENGYVLAGLKVIVVLNGKTKTLTTDSSGAVTLSTKGLAPKTYAAAISFEGNGNYTNSTKSVKITVKKATPKFVAKAKAFKLADKTKKYVVVFKDNNNKVMKSKMVYIKVAGVTYSAKTDSKGQATFKLTKLKKAGSFNAALTFKGNTYYNKCSKSVKIVVKK